MEYEAQFLDNVSAVFPWEDINNAIDRGAAPSPGGEGELIVAGIDWARYSDYTAVVVVCISDEGPRV